jgi:hypothetical protein
MTIEREIEEEKRDEEVPMPLPMPVPGPVPVAMAIKVETQVENHNVQGNNLRDRAEWGTAKFVGPLTWSMCTVWSICGIVLVLFPIGLAALFCPCDDKNVYRVDGKYYDEDDNYLGDGKKVTGIRRRSFRPTYRH